MRLIRIAQPQVDKVAKKEILKILTSGNITQGVKVEEFEYKFAKYIGIKHAIAVSSGTAALHLALVSLGLQKSDEVITTPFSFIASASTICLSGLKPVFADIDKLTYNIDPREIEKKISKRTRAILPVHLYGLPCDMEKIVKIAKKNKLFVIEDACQAHGADINGKKVGSFGDVGCFSFYPTKNMFTGEGGMITTNSSTLADRIRLLRNHGSEKQYIHKLIGYNYRMTDIAATLGILQLEKLEENNRKRIKNSKIISSNLEKISNIIQLPYIPEGYRHVFHQYTISVNKNKEMNRDRLMSSLLKNGIEARVYYPLLIPFQPVFKNRKNKQSFLNAQKAVKSVLSIPIHPLLGLPDLKRIYKTVMKELS